MYALGGVFRGGWRAGYHSPKVFIKIAGSDRRTHVRQTGSLSVRDVLNEHPNTAMLTVDTLAPTKGAEVIITLGSINRVDPIFAGHALGVTQIYEGKPANVAWQVACTDYTWLFNRRKVTKRYQLTSATDIAVDLVETYAPDFSTSGIVAGLETLDEITFTDMEIGDCFTQIARRIGGYWKIDYFGSGPRVNLWATSPINAPVTLIAGPTARFRNLQFTEDLSGVITRVYGEGGGANAIQQIELGETIIPVETAEWYNPSGGTFKSGPQVIIYTGRSLGGGGGLVGPGAAPSSAPALALASGAGIETGSHDYAVTFVTAAGESIASPIATITVGTVAAPSTSPTTSNVSAGGDVTAGNHDYAVTFVTGAGETTPSPVSGSIAAGAQSGTLADPPSTAPTLAQTGTGAYFDGFQYLFTYTFVTPYGETTPSPIANITITGSKSVNITNIAVGPSGTTARKIYERVNGSTRLHIHTINDNTTTSYLSDGGETNGAAEPASNTAYLPLGTVNLTTIPIGPAIVTGRKLYRRFNGAGTYKLVTTIANNSATTYADTTANASLGADAPTTNTATANQVALSAIPIGAASVTQRKIYRTAVGSAQLKLQSTIADNTTTTATDSTADASLGANVPTSDTSGLTQPNGQIAAGSTSIIATGLNAFPASGGWAVTGNGQQVIRYTGVSGTALTGIPASGPGAIVASIAYNSAITAAPQITGVPVSGAGALLFPILRGDPINIWVQRDDAAAQAALALLIGGGFNGVSEGSIQDRRLSEDEIIARCDALLDKKKDARAELRYQTKDVTTQSGAEISANLGPPTNITRTFTIQEVTVTSFEATPAQTDRAYPWYAVVASNDRFSLEDLLRQKRTA